MAESILSAEFQRLGKDTCRMRCEGMHGEGISMTKSEDKQVYSRLSQWLTGACLKLEKHETSHEIKIFKFVLKQAYLFVPKRIPTC